MATMEPEKIINLFETLWFENKILQKTLPEPVSEKTLVTDTKKEISKLPTIHIRAKSDQLSSVKSLQDSLSPVSVLVSPKLQTVYSGKVAVHETEGLKPKKRTKVHKGFSKSLTELEFEELKGFIDLGFVFSEDDVKSELVEILPGLQRLKKKDIDSVKESVRNYNEVMVQRPYLSEAWGKKEKINNPWANLKIQDLDKEMDVKESLKWWAHSVASTVRE